MDQNSKKSESQLQAMNQLTNQTIKSYLIGAALNRQSHIRTLWISSRTDADGDGSQNNPLAIRGVDFDTLMKLLPEHWTLRIYDGHYETVGNCESVNPTESNEYWRMRDGWRILGESREQTIIKMVSSPEKGQTPNQRWYVFGTAHYGEFAHDGMIENLTIESFPSPDIIAGGFCVIGSYNTFRNLTLTKCGAGINTTGECFAGCGGGGHPNFGQQSAGKNNVMENCSLVNPVENQGPGGMTAFMFGMCGEKRNTGEQLDMENNTIRGCYVDGGNIHSAIRAYSVGGNPGRIIGNEATRVESCMHTDTYSTKVILIAGNRCHDVRYGVKIDMGGSALRSGGITGQFVRASGTLLEVGTPAGNAMRPGEWIAVAMGEETRYGTVLSVEPKSWVARMQIPFPEDYADSLQWGRVWTYGVTIIERNSFEMGQTNKGRYAAGISLQGDGLAPMSIPLFGSVVLMSNTVIYPTRITNGPASIRVTHAKDVFEAGNYVSVGYPIMIDKV